MSAFERDFTRYVIIKTSDLDDVMLSKLASCMHYYNIPMREGVVIESDWSVYEDAWALVEKEAGYD